MKYFVIAYRYNEEKGAIVKEIVGEFKEYHFAALFMLAYNKEYKADAKVVSESELLSR